jgi:hypothetical protein
MQDKALSDCLIGLACRTGQSSCNQAIDRQKKGDSQVEIRSHCRAIVSSRYGIRLV